MTVYGIAYEVSDATYVKLYLNTNGGKKIIVDSVTSGNPLWVRGLETKNNDNGTQLGYFTNSILSFDVSSYDYFLLITKSNNPGVFDGLRIE